MIVVQNGQYWYPYDIVNEKRLWKLDRKTGGYKTVKFLTKEKAQAFVDAKKKEETCSE